MSSETEVPLARAVVATVVLAVLHFLLQPLLASWWGSPHLVAGAVLVGARGLRPGGAAAAGFTLGLLEEAIVLSTVGPLGVVYAVGGFVAGRSWDLFFTDSRLFLPVYLFAGGWTLIAAGVLVGPDDATWRFVVLEAPVSALVTAVLCLPAGRALTSRA